MPNICTVQVVNSIMNDIHNISLCIFCVTLCAATTVQFETTNFRVNENGGSVELVLVADQTHHKDQIVGLAVTDITTSKSKIFPYM